MIFDGRAFAREMEEVVKVKVAGMAVKPKVVSILVGNDPASELYTRLKKQAAERVGIDFVIHRYTNESLNHLKAEIAGIGAKGDVTGLMVQLPVPGLSPAKTQDILAAIPLDKDVDGLRWETSRVAPATVRAVLAILERIKKMSDRYSQMLTGKYVVVGYRGAVGEPLVEFLRKAKLDVDGVEWDTPDPGRIVAGADVIISCTGKAGLITGEMVRDGVIAVDVGSPKGDMTQEVYAKASVAVAVPGGVGPVTIASLMQNAVELLPDDESRGSRSSVL